MMTEKTLHNVMNTINRIHNVNYYNRDDEDIDIDWPLEKIGIKSPLLSEKDSNFRSIRPKQKFRLQILID